MLTTATVLAVALLTGTFVLLKRERVRLYRSLADVQSRILAAAPSPNIRLEKPAPPFASRLARVGDFLPAATYSPLRHQIEQLVTTERSYLPTHKKGGTIAYETLCRQAPAVIRLYLDPGFISYLSQLTGEVLKPCPLADQSACSILFYERPGDHIGWHFDHNFYRGRHFTVLLAIVNRGHSEDRLSAARLIAKLNGSEVQIETAPNTLVVFEGAKVEHRVTPIGEGERRVILSMTYCTDTRATLAQGAKRRIKDMAFFGVRALWT
jgi:hypothetical protein